MRALLWFAGRKLLQYLALLLLVTFATFALSNLIPGDFFTSIELDNTVSRAAIEEMRRRHAFDQPLIVQYGLWLAGIARLDLGTSLFYGIPVRTVVAEA